MSLLTRINKLLDKQSFSKKKTYFIIAISKEEEEIKVSKIKADFNGNENLLMITVFKLYD